ncbi:beta-lactamase-like protein [Massariosphaeria phaeospora]|uniref:Beta-lactamase-like protein n=1 Tax=Massariosphaeria phaeospora TaxID=100035 RepID=A0A7C8M5Q6_9PLEO|nr:beta-lactamase-like protein [Massariosphaeria phaeospora]
MYIIRRCRAPLPSHTPYSTMTEALLPLPTVERLSSRVIRVLGGNPGKFTLQGTNTYIVGHGPQRLLIDTGEGAPGWLASLKSVLATEQATITTALLTHWHPDHIGGVPDLLSLNPDTKVYKNSPSVPTQLPIGPDQTFSTAGATLRAFFCPGHTTDHMAFVLEEEDAMFTADNVLGQGTAVFEDLGAYMQSLEGMAVQFKGRAYPGHGPVIEDGLGRITEYIKHRRQREIQVLEVLGQQLEGDDGNGGTARERWTPLAIVRLIYKDYPQSLWAPAERGIRQILAKLAQESKVVHDEGSDTWSLSSSSSSNSSSNTKSTL